MGVLALAHLGVRREKDHGLFVFPELGEGHPQTCMMDGIQVATGATYGKVLMAKTFYGKLAAVFFHPEKGGVRFALRPDFIDAMGKLEFFTYRKRGIEPSEIPGAVTNEVIEWAAGQADDATFKIEPKPEFRFIPVKGSFKRALCSSCGEYVFERYLRTKDGNPLCIPCSGYAGPPASN
ncbi:MAG: FmdE family protein [Acidobacteria bacterium]|nr:FmdE family protein [Acidobacteriota bacterium]